MCAHSTACPLRFWAAAKELSTDILNIGASFFWTNARGTLHKRQTLPAIFESGLSRFLASARGHFPRPSEAQHVAGGLFLLERGHHCAPAGDGVLFFFFFSFFLLPVARRLLSSAVLTERERGGVSPFPSREKVLIHFRHPVDESPVRPQDLMFDALILARQQDRRRGLPVLFWKGRSSSGKWGDPSSDPTMKLKSWAQAKCKVRTVVHGRDAAFGSRERRWTPCFFSSLVTV